MMFSATYLLRNSFGLEGAENAALVWIMSIFINVGMWFERFVITVTSLANDFLPTSWGYYSSTMADILPFLAPLACSACSSFFSFLLPLMPIAEVKFVMPEADPMVIIATRKETNTNV